MTGTNSLDKGLQTIGFRTNLILMLLNKDVDPADKDINFLQQKRPSRGREPRPATPRSKSVYN